MRKMNPWTGVIAVEGTPTGDGRTVRRKALKWEPGDLPIPMLLRDGTPCGRVDKISRDTGSDKIHASGVTAVDPGDYPVAVDLAPGAKTTGKTKIAVTTGKVGVVRVLTDGGQPAWPDAVITVTPVGE